MKRIAALAIGAAFAVTASAKADLIISEIFYNLSGSEGATTEWAEIYNTGDTAVDISGYSIADLQDNSFSGAIANGTIIPAGGAMVITAQDPATFATIWGPGISVAQVADFPSLSNSASPTNELVALLDTGAASVDEVNYEVGSNDWPGDANGESIYLLPSALSAAANDFGASWATSVIGVDGAYEALALNPDISNASTLDVASPGVVVVPEPASLVLIGLGALAVIRRR